MTRLCRAKTRSGKQCRAHPGRSGLCWAHDPALSGKRAGARRVGGRRRAYAPDPVGTDELATVQGLQRALERVLEATWAQDNTPRRTRALVAVYGLAYRMVEVEDLTARVEALEQMLPR